MHGASDVPAASARSHLVASDCHPDCSRGCDPTSSHFCFSDINITAEVSTGSKQTQTSESPRARERSSACAIFAPAVAGNCQSESKRLPTKKRVKPVVIQKPELVLLDASTDSKDLELKPTKNKGQGVFAKRKIPPNSRLAYGGVVISKQEKAYLFRLALKDQQSTAALYITETGIKDEYEDANPARKENLENIYGGRINEPDVDERANCLLTTDTLSGKSRAVFISIEEIPEGHELTAHYGTEYQRSYEVGKPATEPSWW